MSRRTGLRSIPIAGTPVNGTNEQQTITINGGPTGGTFKLSFEGNTSAAIAYNATAAALQAILEAMGTIGVGSVLVTGNAGGPYTAVFQGNLGKLALSQLLVLAVNSLIGGAAPTVAMAQTVPGVTATQRGSEKGTTLIDTENAILYQNTGTALAPMWDKANCPLSDAGDPGDNTLRVAANVASAETVTIGDDIYEVEIVNTDSTDNAQGGDFVPVTNPLTVIDAVTNYPGNAFAVGDLIRIGNEIMKVSVNDGADVTFIRGVSATTIATHADAADMYLGDGVTAGNIPVGIVATLTPVVFIAALTADINTFGTELITAMIPGVTNAMYIYTSVTAGDGVPVGSEEAIATTETLAGADNVWSVAAVEAGRRAGDRLGSMQVHTVTATEVAVGIHLMQFPFTIIGFLTQAFDSTGLAKDSLTSLVTIENNNQIAWTADGAKNLAADDKIHVLAWGN